MCVQLGKFKFVLIFIMQTNYDETNQTKYQYVGLSSGPFKYIYYSHTHSFRHKKIRIPSSLNVY